MESTLGCSVLGRARVLTLRKPDGVQTVPGCDRHTIEGGTLQFFIGNQDKVKSE